MKDENRRHFSRVKFNARAILKKNDLEVNAFLLDIALKGVLIEIEDMFPIKMRETCDFELHLNGTDIVLTIRSQLVYQSEDNKMGFEFKEMELDTLTHLRRLIELNVGDPELVQKELSFF